MKRTILAVAILVASAYPLMTAYKVEPVKASWSGMADAEDGISQTITCNFDSIKRVELFIGGIGAGGGFNFEVMDAVTEDLVAYKYNVTPEGDHRWLPFEDLTVAGSFTKGKIYSFKFTRSGSDSIQYYYDSTDAYQWGSIILPGQQAPIPDPAKSRGHSKRLLTRTA